MTTAKDERNSKVIELYYGGYSRRAVAEAFNISTQRVYEILERDARRRNLEWPAISVSGGLGTRYDHPSHYKPIPAEALDAMSDEVVVTKFKEDVEGGFFRPGGDKITGEEVEEAAKDKPKRRSKVHPRDQP